MQYLDPITNENQTCSNPCPLLTNSSVLYQDFLFNDALSITGVLVKLSEWTGSAPGLHILQILSSGAFASAVESENGASCFSPEASTASFTGSWNPKVANTDIAGTIQSVLVSSVDVGTSASAGPTFTWMPYVSASGDYEMNMLVPGCSDFQDCDSRTSVKVTVFPGDNLDPSVTTISQRNTDDATTLIYSGPIISSSPNFVTTVTMTLGDNPEGNGSNGKYELVADRIQLVLTSANVSSFSSNSSNSSTSNTSSTKSSFGFLEWPLSSSSNIDATAKLPNSTETALDNIGFDLFAAVGDSSSASSQTPSVVVAVAHHVSGVIFLGGNFSLSSGTASGSANLVAFKSGALVALSGNGLNGPVTSLVLDGDDLFVGGSFSDTQSGTTSGSLRGVAMYSVQKNSWTALGGGVDGNVKSLDLNNGQVQVAGDITELLSSSTGDSALSASGFGTWDINTSSWVSTGGFIAGEMTFVGNGTSTSTQFVAGNVAAFQKFGASGMVMLSNSGNDVPDVTPLGVQLESGVSSGNTTSTSSRRRSHIPRAAAWFSHHVKSQLFAKRATTVTALPSPLPAPAPAVLAGAFWTNGSSSVQVAIIGGNFSFTAGTTKAEGVAIYDSDSGSITALQGNQVNGTVRALLVDGDLLYIGGEFTISGLNANGLAIYDLAAQKWDVSDVQALQAGSGTSVVVRSITTSSSKDNTIIVAGTFAQAGSLRCNAICSLDTSSKQWNTLGNGIQGEISSISYAGVRLITLSRHLT